MSDPTSGGVDAWWTSNSSLGASAFGIAPGNVDWFYDYAPNSSQRIFRGSGWISDNASSDYNGPAPYTFSMIFDLSHFVLSTVRIHGAWSVADAGTLEVNGNLVASLTNAPWTIMHPFAITNPALLNPGLNTIHITITAADAAFEAARFEGVVNGTLR